MKTHQAFNAVSLATLVLSHAVWQAQRLLGLDFRSLVVLALIYGFSIWLRDRFYDEKTTFFDSDSRVLPVKSDGLIIFGEQVEDLAFESRERRLLISLVDFGGQKYKIYLAWIVSSAIAVYLQFRIGGLDIVESAASFLMITGIYFSPFLNQRLVPLFTSFAIAIYAFGRSSDLKVTGLFGVFLAAFTYAMILYRDVLPDRINPDRKFSEKRRLRSAGLMVLAAVFIYGVVDYLVPEENPFRRKPHGVVVDPKARPKLSTEKISRELAEQVVKFGEKNREASAGPQGSESGEPDQGSNKSSNSGTSNSSEGAAGDLHSGGSSQADQAPGDRSGESSGDRNGDPAGDRAGAEPQPHSGKAPVASQAEKSSEKASDGNSETEHATNSGTKAAASKAQGGASSNSDGKKNGSGVDGDSSQAKPGSELSAASKSKIGSAQSEKRRKEHEKKVEDLQKEIKLPLELAKGIVFLLLAGAAVFALFRYFSKPKSKEEEVVRQVLTSKQQQKLQTLLQRIKARGLSPYDEIVETYNALLTVFELGHHPREEWLPAEDFSNQIAASIPGLSKPFCGVTKQFSKTLYGRKNVGLDELEKFRDEVAQVLKFFQLS